VPLRVVGQFGLTGSTTAPGVAPDSRSGDAPQVGLRVGLVMVISALMTLAVDSAPLHSSWRGQPQHSCLQAPQQRGSCAVHRHVSALLDCARMRALPKLELRHAQGTAHAGPILALASVKASHFILSTLHYSNTHMVHPLCMACETQTCGKTMSVMSQNVCRPVCYARPFCDHRQGLMQAAGGQMCAGQEQHDTRCLQPVTSLHTCLTCQQGKLVLSCTAGEEEAGCARHLTVLGFQAMKSKVPSTGARSSPHRKPSLLPAPLWAWRPV
jgi:hypothetical protein